MSHRMLRHRSTLALATVPIVAFTVFASAAVLAFDGGPDRHRAAPPPIFDDGASPPLLAGGLAMATTEYSHGDPTDEEQLFLELMNRARLDPAGEADRMLTDFDAKVVRDAVTFFLKERPGVEYTRQENHDNFEQLPAVPPYAFNAALSSAARNHSAVMRAADQQVHQAVGESPLRERTTNAGYQGAGLGESIYAFAKNMLHAHAGFSVDWGQSCSGGPNGQCVGGERPPVGHRDSLMSSDFREVGVGVVGDDDPDTSVGPRLITIDFGAALDNSERLVTGVVFDDTDDDGMYSIGEGIAGVRIETDASDFFAVSSSSGGYSVPVPRNAGTVTVFAMGEPGTAGEPVGEQQVVVQVTGGNAKVDFGPKPEPSVPEFSAFSVASVGLLDGTTQTSGVVVGAIDPANPTLGDIELDVAIDHDARNELTLTLVSPAGTEVVLFDGAPGGADLRGTFDRTLSAAENLGAFVGEAYAGTWTVRVADAAGGITDGRLESFTLRIRPTWVRPLYAPASPLAVKSLKVKDSAKPGKDKLVLKADVNAGGTLLDASRGGLLRLVDASNGATYLEVDLPATGPAAKRATPDGATVKAKLDLNRSGSSHGAIVVKVSGLDLPSAAPASLRIELVLGDALLAQTVATAGGKLSGPSLSPLFVVDKLKSKVGLSGDRSTTVAGRFSPVGEGVLTGVVELLVGSARFQVDVAELGVKGNKRTFKGTRGLKKLVLDLARGTFTAKVTSKAAIRVNGKTPVSLRIGGSFYGETDVLPFDKGTKTLY